MAEDRTPTTESLIQRISAARTASLKERIKAGREAGQGSAREFVEGRTGFDRAFRQGMFFGFADEAEAGIRAIWDRIPGEDYGDAYLRLRSQIRGEMAKFREGTPAVSLGAEVAGGLALPGLGTGGAVAGGATAGGRILRGAGAGAGAGALFGAGTAEEIEDIPREAAMGAVVGGVAGAVVPGAVEAGHGAFSAVRSLVSPETGAARRIGRALQRDEMTPEQITGALEEAQGLGKPATVAEVGGESIRRELEVSVQSPGPAAQLAEQVLSKRSQEQEQLGRLSVDLVKGTGVKANAVQTAITNAMALRSRAAAPVYERAMNFQAELDDDIVDAWKAATKTPLGKQALGKAKKILNVEDFDQAPLMEKIDAFKRGLDDVIGAAKRGGENAIAKKALEVKNELVELVDAANPAYKQAREIWGDGSSYLAAIDRGGEILKPGFTAAKVGREFAELTDAEKEAFRIGAVDAIITRMRQNSAQEPNLIKIVRSPEMRDKLKAIMSPGQAIRLDKLINIEDAMFRTAAQARKGSQTFRREAAKAELERQVGIVGIVEELSSVVITPLRNLVMQKLPSVARGTRERLLARQNAAITRRLLSTDPDDLLSIPQSAMRPPRLTGGIAIPAPVIATEAMGP